MAKRIALSSRAAELFDNLSWPSAQEEAWRRTDLSRLLPKGLLDKTTDDSHDRPLNDIADGPAPLLPENFAARIITRAGRPIAMACSEDAEAAGLEAFWASPDEFPESMFTMGYDELGMSPDKITAWHWRDTPGALIIRVPENICIDAPVFIEEQLIANGDEKSLFAAPHLHVETGAGAALNVVWTLEGAPASNAHSKPVINANLTGLAQADSVMNITMRQNLGSNAVFFFSGNLCVKKKGKAMFTESQLGACLIKTHTKIVLAENGADAKLKGLYIVKKGQHMDMSTTQDHRHPHTTSDALYKGAIHSDGRSIFQGLINVSPDAKKTDAYLTNKNLILGNGARADSMPQLNILTDDVKCSHGSTTGGLDERHLFYLQSRGYSPEDATQELTRAFLEGTLKGIASPVKDLLTLDIDSALEIA